jgi:hypothetical protein
VQAVADIEGCCMDRFLGCLGPEVKMVARGSTLETAKYVSGELRRKGTVFAPLGWFMKRTFTAYLIALLFDDDKP